MVDCNGDRLATLSLDSCRVVLDEQEVEDSEQELEVVVDGDSEVSP